MTQETRRDLRFPVLAVVATLAALAVVVATAPTAPRVTTFAQGAVLALLLAAIVVSEMLDVLYPKSVFSVSMSFPLGIAVAAYFGPAYALPAGLFHFAHLLLTRTRRRWDKLLFNIGQITLTFAVAGVIYQSLAGALLIAGRTDPAAIPRVIFAAAVAVLVGVAVNGGLVTAGTQVLYGTPLRETFQELTGPVGRSQFILGLVGVMLAEVVAAIGPAGLALFVVPLLVARQTYERTVQLRAAYADTIASLVAALEAKDVYTKGHSIRVAKYATATARVIGMAESKIERLEWAALLHDIGKVGVSRRVLSKNGKLSDDEYTEIKRHPAIGADILAGVPYLADLVPSIAAHHERLDGSGYGSGARGVDIPAEARVLAVVDAYDAMTSTRPYRTAMSHDAAVAELERGRDTQFDSSVVDAFLVAASDESFFAEAVE